MDIATITQLIGNLGFPIVVAGVCMYYMYKKDISNSDLIKSMNDQHKEEVEHLREAVENNTVAINALMTAIKGDTAI